MATALLACVAVLTPQLGDAANKVIDTSAEYTGPEHRKVEPISERG